MRFHPNHPSPVCLIGHQHGFRSDQELKRHINRVHKFDKTGETDGIMGVLEEQKSGLEDLSESELIMKNRYWKYYGDGIPNTDGKYPDETLPALPHLRIVTLKQCTKCFSIIGNDQKNTAHMKACGSELRTVQAQSILFGKVIKYFRVEPVGADGNEVNWLYARLVEIEKEESSSGEIVPDIKEVGAFMSQLRCQDHLQTFGLSVEEAWKSINWYKTDSLEEDLVKRVKVVTREYIQSAIRVNSKNVFVKTHLFLGQRLQISLGERTVTEYTNKLCSMVFFLIHMYRKQKDFKDGGSAAKGNKILSMDQMDAMTELLDVATESSEVKLVFHTLLVTLFLSVDGEDVEAVPLFIACCCVLRDHGEEGREYRFAYGSDISHIVAALLYCIQCVVVQEVYGKICATAREDDEHRAVFSLTRVGNCKWADIEELEKKKEDCGAIFVRYCMDVCNRIRSTEMAHIRFVVCQKHRHCGILDGKELSLDTLGKAVQNVQSKMRQIMDEHVLVGFRDTLDKGGFWKEVSGAMDNFSERRSKFWFMKHPSNKGMFEKWLQRYTMHMAETGLAKSDGSLEKGKCKSFLHHSEIIIKQLLWLMHITGGGPARLTELMTVQYRNGKFGCRNVYMQQGELLFVVLVHKGREKAGGVGKPIARFPDVETGNLLLIYLAFIRPLETLIHNNENMDRADSSRASQNWSNDGALFSVRGHPLTDRMGRHWFRKTMKEECDEDIQVSEYRQFHAGVIKNFVSANVDQNDDEDGFNGDLKNSLHEQSGHGVETANKDYAVSEVDMRNLDSVALERARRASYHWHRMLKIERGRNEKLIEGSGPVGQQHLILGGDGGINDNRKIN